MSSINALKAFQTRLGYTFKNDAHLIAALTHRSYAFEHDSFLQNNQRLELLGDAILDFIIADELCLRFHDLQEGELSRLRSRLVCEAALSQLARKLAFEEVIRMGKGEITAAGTPITHSAAAVRFCALPERYFASCINNSASAISQRHSIRYSGTLVIAICSMKKITPRAVK